MESLTSIIPQALVKLILLRYLKHSVFLDLTRINILLSTRQVNFTKQFKTQFFLDLTRINIFFFLFISYLLNFCITFVKITNQNEQNFNSGDGRLDSVKVST